MSDYGRAEACWSDALTLYEKLGEREGQVACTNNLAEVYRLTGRYDQALQYYKGALAQAREIGYRLGVGTVLGNMNVVYRLRGDYTAALRANEEALMLYREIGDLSNCGGQLKDQGLIATALGNYPRALECFREALMLAQQLAEPPLALAVFCGMAALWVRTGRAARAGELVGYVVNHPANNPEVQLIAEQVLGQLQLTLTVEGLEAALAHGRGLTFGEVIEGILKEGS